LSAARWTRAWASPFSASPAFRRRKELASLATPAWRPWLPRPLLLPALLALALTAASFFAQWRIDFNIADEGFLWYGAIATAHGQVPLRDFLSYDPGRYYWAAAWAQLFGDGILALRLSAAIFQALGLLLGLLAARRAVTRPWWLAIVGTLLLVWMIPRHKVFEPCVAMAAVWVGVRLLEHPSRGRHFAAGLLAGLAAFFGKNLGLYCLAAMLCLALVAHASAADPQASAAPAGAPAGPSGRPNGRPAGWPAPRSLPTARPRLRQRLAALAAGLFTGLLPLLAMFCIPGFFASFVESCFFFLRLGRTNFAEPIPWPWLAFVPGLDLGERMQQLSLALSFLLLIIGTTAALAVGWKNLRRDGRPPALLLAGGIVGAFFLHHAFARADSFHLGQSVHPLLLAALALPSGGRSRERRLSLGPSWGATLIATLFLFSTLFTAIPEAPLFHKLAPDNPAERFVPFDLAGDHIYVRQHAARVLAALRQEFSQEVPLSEPVLFATHFAGLYPFLGRRSPVWEIYPIWPGQGRRDERMLRELQENHVRWALIGAYRKQGGEKLSLAQTHPQVWSYLMRDFVRVPSRDLPRRFLLLHKP
jgi:hypothetical protein